MSYAVKWTNPVTGITRNMEFATREEAEAYIAGRVRKYGNAEGFTQPGVVELRRITATAIGNNPLAQVIVTSIGLPLSNSLAHATTRAAAFEAFEAIWHGPPASVDVVEDE